MESVCFHLRPLFDPEKFKRIIAQMYVKLKKIKFDAIAVTGLSGSMIGPTIAAKLGKRLIVVRKHESRVASGSTNVEFGAKKGAEYIFIDDLISSGGTIERVIKEIKQADKTAKCIGIALYNQEMGTHCYADDREIPIVFCKNFNS